MTKASQHNLVPDRQTVARICHLEPAKLQTVCSYCKSVKHGDQWDPFTKADEAYSHGVCPDCYTTTIPDMMREIDDANLAASA